MVSAMITWLVAITLFAILAAILAREFLVLGAVRRAGNGTKADFARFRRRSLGVTLTTILLAMLFAEERVGAALGDGLEARRIMLVYYGLCMILVLWVLMVAVRDFHITLLGAMDENRRITVDGLEEMNRTVRRARGLPQEDDLMIAPGARLMNEAEREAVTDVFPAQEPENPPPAKIRSRGTRKRRHHS